MKRITANERIDTNPNNPRFSRSSRLFQVAVFVAGCIILVLLATLLTPSRQKSALEKDIELYLSATTRLDDHDANLISLVELGKPAVPHLARRALWKPNWRDRLGQLAWDYNALRYLRSHVPDPADYRRKSRRQYGAVVALGKMGPAARDSLPVLRRLAQDDSWSERLVALRAILQIGPEKRDIPVFLHALKDEYHPCRVQGARGLGRLGPLARECIPELKRALSDTDESVRRAVNEALSAMGTDPGRQLSAPKG